MNIQYIYHKIRKKTLISAIIPVVFLVFLIFMAYNFPFKEVFSPITYSNVSKLDTAFTSRKDYVSLSDITLYYTGYDSVKNSQVVGKYFYAIENNKCYFFLLNSEKALESDTFITFEHLKLQLSSLDLNYNNLLTNLSEDINWQYTHMAEVSPQYVAVEYRGMLTYSYIFALLLTFMGIYTLVILLIHIVTFICPQLEKGLFPKTPFQQKKQLFQKLDWELSEANSFNSFIPLFANDGAEFYITDSFIINFSLFDTYIIPLENILWIYKHTKKLSHGVSEMPNIYTLHIVLTTGTHIQLKNYMEKNADALIALLSNKNPHILTGYSHEHKILAKKCLNYIHTAKKHGIT